MRTLLIALASALSWWDPAAIQPRQQGVCITEWEGGERREIPVVVLGALDASTPERQAVLVRIVDDSFIGSGVVAGMSGSPVYVDGKLLGAVAFGWSFAKEPLAGVTPFAQMHEIRPGPAAPGTQPTPIATLAGLATGAVAPAAALPELSITGRSELLPVAVGGLPPAHGFGEQVLARAALAAIPAAGVVELSGIPEAGEMVAGLLVWGDAVLAAGGTVTARDGDRVWAFGHPFFSLGSVRIPAARARTIAVQTSYQSSFKIFGVGEPFGTFVADRPAGMLAHVGEAPAGLALSVRLREPSGEKSWSFRIAEVPILEPLLATFLTNACLTARGAANGEASVRVRIDVELVDGTTVSVEQATRGTDALARIAGFVGGVVAYLEGSSFPHPRLAALRIELERHEEPIGASILQAVPERTSVRPGEPLSVTVVLQPERGAIERRRLTLTVPRHLREGSVDLIVSDGAAWSEYRLRAEGIAPASFADEMAQLEALESASVIVAALETKDRGVARPGASQPGLPPSWSATLAAGLGARGMERLATATVAQARWQGSYPIVGASRIPITVLPPR